MLAAKCYKCHSERARKIKGKLKLDSREAILKGGSEGPSRQTSASHQRPSAYWRSPYSFHSMKLSP